MKHYLLSLIAFCVFVSQPACSGSSLPSHYSAEAIEAWVVDAETKKPIEGVIVVADWQLEGGMHVDKVGSMMLMETVTDATGKFRFPAWGPKKIPTNLPWNSRLTFYDPMIILFKPGYDYRVEENPLTTDALKGKGGPIRSSQWDGKVIELKRANTPADVQFKSLLNLSKEVEGFAFRNTDPCQWTKLPKLVAKIMQERIRLEAKGISSKWDRTLDQRLLDGEEHFISICGHSARTVLGEMKR